MREQRQGWKLRVAYTESVSLPRKEYSPLGDALLSGVLIAFAGTTFLFSISTQKVVVFWQYSRSFIRN